MEGEVGSVALVPDPPVDMLDDDVLRCIFDFVHGGYDSRSLLPAMMVCRRWHQLILLDPALRSFPFRGGPFRLKSSPLILQSSETRQGAPGVYRNMFFRAERESGKALLAVYRYDGKRIQPIDNNKDDKVKEGEGLEEGLELVERIPLGWYSNQTDKHCLPALLAIQALEQRGIIVVLKRQPKATVKYSLIVITEREGRFEIQRKMKLADASNGFVISESANAVFVLDFISARFEHAKSPRKPITPRLHKYDLGEHQDSVLPPRLSLNNGMIVGKGALYAVMVETVDWTEDILPVHLYKLVDDDWVQLLSSKAHRHLQTQYLSQEEMLVVSAQGWKKVLLWDLATNQESTLTAHTPLRSNVCRGYEGSLFFINARKKLGARGYVLNEIHKVFRKKTLRWTLTKCKAKVKEEWTGLLPTPAARFTLFMWNGSLMCAADPSKGNPRGLWEINRNRQLGRCFEEVLPSYSFYRPLWHYAVALHDGRLVIPVKDEDKPLQSLMVLEMLPDG